jgi:hypothetical protein
VIAIDEYFAGEVSVGRLCQLLLIRKQARVRTKVCSFFALEATGLPALPLVLFFGGIEFIV